MYTKQYINLKDIQDRAMQTGWGTNLLHLLQDAQQTALLPVKYHILKSSNTKSMNSNYSQNSLPGYR